MPRGPKPAKSNEARPPGARKSSKDDGARVRDLEKRLAEALQRLAEALEQQTATAEILRVISSSPTDIQPVFDAIVESSVKLCTAKFGVVFRFDGDMLNFVAHHNLDPAALKAYQSMLPRRPEPNQLTGTAI